MHRNTPGKPVSESELPSTVTLAKDCSRQTQQECPTTVSLPSQPSKQRHIPAKAPSFASRAVLLVLSALVMLSVLEYSLVHGIPLEPGKTTEASKGPKKSTRAANRRGSRSQSPAGGHRSTAQSGMGLRSASTQSFRRDSSRGRANEQPFGRRSRPRQVSLDTDSFSEFSQSYFNPRVLGGEAAGGTQPELVQAQYFPRDHAGMQDGQRRRARFVEGYDEESERRDTGRLSRRQRRDTRGASHDDEDLIQDESSGRRGIRQTRQLTEGKVVKAAKYGDLTRREQKLYDFLQSASELTNDQKTHIVQQMTAGSIERVLALIKNKKFTSLIKEARDLDRYQMLTKEQQKVVEEFLHQLKKYNELSSEDKALAQNKLLLGSLHRNLFRLELSQHSTLKKYLTQCKQIKLSALEKEVKKFLIIATQLQYSGQQGPIPPAVKVSKESRRTFPITSGFWQYHFGQLLREAKDLKKQFKSKRSESTNKKEISENALEIYNGMTAYERVRLLKELGFSSQGSFLTFYELLPKVIIREEAAAVDQTGFPLVKISTKDKKVMAAYEKLHKLKEAYDASKKSTEDIFIRRIKKRQYQKQVFEALQELTAGQKKQIFMQGPEGIQKDYENGKAVPRLLKRDKEVCSMFEMAPLYELAELVSQMKMKQQQTKAITEEEKKQFKQLYEQVSDSDIKAMLKYQYMNKQAYKDMFQMCKGNLQKKNKPKQSHNPKKLLRSLKAYQFYKETQIIIRIDQKSQQQMKIKAQEAYRKLSTLNKNEHGTVIQDLQIISRQLFQQQMKYYKQRLSQAGIDINQDIKQFDVQQSDEEEEQPQRDIVNQETTRTSTGSQQQQGLLDNDQIFPSGQTTGGQGQQPGEQSPTSPLGTHSSVQPGELENQPIPARDSQQDNGEQEGMGANMN